VPVADWPAVLAGLDEQWSAAFSAGDLARLRAVDAAGSPALRGDSALLQQYLDAGVVLRGLRLERLHVAVAEVTDDRVTLKVVDRIAPYDLVDTAGGVVRTDPGRGETSWHVTLARIDIGSGGSHGAHDAWRIVSVARAPS